MSVSHKNRSMKKFSRSRKILKSKIFVERLWKEWGGGAVDNKIIKYNTNNIYTNGSSLIIAKKIDFTKDATMKIEVVTTNDQYVNISLPTLLFKVKIKDGDLYGIEYIGGNEDETFNRLPIKVSNFQDISDDKILFTYQNKKCIVPKGIFNIVHEDEPL